jgi:cysteinyl-tRNA synthetase
MHGGGRDLIFPHHENERAQSEAATGKTFVRFWMHNGLLYTGGQKMSKSLGNFFLIEDILQKFDADTVRFYLISTHFRSQAEFSEKRLEEARAAFERLREGWRRVGAACDAADSGSALVSEAGVALRELANRVRADFMAAMEHDFNTAGALGKLFELVRESNRFLDDASGDHDRNVLDVVETTLRELLLLLGFSPSAAPASDAAAPEPVRVLAEERIAARAARDWARADALRREILTLGYVVEDRPDGYRLKPNG